MPILGEDAQREHHREPGRLVGSNELPSASRHVVSQNISTMRSLDSMPSAEILQSAEACTPSLESSSSRYVYSTHNVDLEELFKIVNASLQIMICNRRPAKAGGIVVSSDEGYPKLAALSPALFSPGYAQVSYTAEPKD